MAKLATGVSIMVYTVDRGSGCVTVGVGVACLSEKPSTPIEAKREDCLVSLVM